ncbi:MAG TPA: hypothetical protein VGR21_06735, partial [Cryptosporangiaceae bacterium]|nr:hypothetical protein [Cryptosporangiaceae bacterium]
MVAPAGSGKTTLLTQYAAGREGLVAWYRAEPAEAAVPVLVRHLRQALDTVLDLPRASDPGDLDELLTGVASTLDTDLLLVVDDLHRVAGTDAIRALERFVALAPPMLHVLAGSRQMPPFNLSRHELSDVVVIDAGRLRFRSWEVERLLRDVYGEPLPPDDVAALARRTGGWAAGLQMFHLSTKGQPLTARRNAVASLDGRSALARTYLTHTVFDELPQELRDFLVRTCVFDVLTGERCDRLLEVTGSWRRLEELERRQAFTVSDDGGRSFRYHEVLRRHLEVSLVEELGDAGARRWYAAAAALLEREEAYAEAARAYGRAEDWPSVRRLLGGAGGSVTKRPDQHWGDVLPAWLVNEDPWLVTAEARHQLAHGRVDEAVENFRRAEEMFTDERGRQRCRQGRRLAAVWQCAEVRPRLHWTDWFRAATRRHPAVIAAEATRLPSPAADLVAVSAHLLAGNLTGARA